MQLTDSWHLKVKYNCIANLVEDKEFSGRFLELGLLTFLIEDLRASSEGIDEMVKTA